MKIRDEECLQIEVESTAPDNKETVIRTREEQSASIIPYNRVNTASVLSDLLPFWQTLY